MTRFSHAGLALAAVLVAACSSDIVTTPGNLAMHPGVPRHSISGAFNTNLFNGGNCSVVNGNLYPAKDDVALNGNPSILDAGDYWLKVESPNGTLLGASPSANFHVAIGSECVQLVALVNKVSDNTAGFDDTSNPGGEYKVTISHDGSFPPGDVKSDNFKVLADQSIVSVSTVVTVNKFYDANTNGIQDNGETNISGWKVSVAPFIGSAYDVLTPYSANLDNGFYTFTEYSTVQTNWFHTTASTFSRTIGVDSPDITFGNVCVGAGGGLTLGFWSNKNGQALVGSGDLSMLNVLFLRNAAGADQSFGNYAAFRTWILNATATNMAYMLSAQLAAMELNVYNGLVSGGTLVYAPGTTSANAAGFASVGAIMAEANASLQSNPLTPSGAGERAHQEALKNALDAANNNLNFVQSSPCAFSFAITQ